MNESGNHGGGDSRFGCGLAPGRTGLCSRVSASDAASFGLPALPHDVELPLNRPLLAGAEVKKGYWRKAPLTTWVQTLNCEEIADSRLRFNSRGILPSRLPKRLPAWSCPPPQLRSRASHGKKRATTCPAMGTRQPEVQHSRRTLWRAQHSCAGRRPGWNPRAFIRGQEP